MDKDKLQKAYEAVEMLKALDGLACQQGSVERHR